MPIREIYRANNLHMQETDYTCGPSAILNVLLRQGKPVRTEPELAGLCNTEPVAGTKSVDMAKAAKTAGLTIVEEKENAEITDIERHVDAGHYVIVLYYHLYSEVGHYAVVAEYDDRAFYFFDSSYGLLRLKKAKFFKYWYNTDKTVHRWFLAVK